MANPFSGMLEKTLKNEGSSVDTLLPGIISRYGVQQNALDSFNQRKGLPLERVESVDPKKVQQLYYEDYYLQPGYNKLPEKVATQLFDFGVQSGTPRATSFLQAVVGAKPDGKLGPKTLAAVNQFIETHGEDALASNIVSARKQFIDKIIQNNPKKYGPIAKGLRNRVSAMEALYGKN